MAATAAAQPPDLASGRSCGGWEEVGGGLEGRGLGKAGLCRMGPRGLFGYFVSGIKWAGMGACILCLT